MTKENVIPSPTSSDKYHLFDIKDNATVASLPPFLRVLLTTDGTVTSSLQAYFWERVVVDTKEQTSYPLGEAFEVLDLQAGQEVLHRQVELRGETSGKIYAQASSLIRMELLPDHIKASIVARTMGVGELLRDCGLETYRQILDVGVDLGESDTEKGDSGNQHAWRSYLIVMDKRPFIHITERFPLALF